MCVYMVDVFIVCEYMGTRTRTVSKSSSTPPVPHVRGHLYAVKKKFVLKFSYGVRSFYTHKMKDTY